MIMNGKKLFYYLLPVRYLLIYYRHNLRSENVDQHIGQQGAGAPGQASPVRHLGPRGDPEDERHRRGHQVGLQALFGLVF
jgi:hypothetical protein